MNPSGPSGPCDHWESIYSKKTETGVSRYQPHADRSLQLIRSASPDHSASIIDVGGGASALVDDLLAGGYADIAVLDIAEAALSRARARLAEKADKVEWIVADVTRWMPPRKWGIWHDRAVFHFLTEKDQQDAYIAALAEGTGANFKLVSELAERHDAPQGSAQSCAYSVLERRKST